jgi:hypothetical protein
MRAHIGAMLALLAPCHALLLTSAATARPPCHCRARVLMVERRANEAEKVVPMPERLAAWGCDDDLWDSLRAKGRTDLKRMARDGKEQMARARIAKVRKTVAKEAALAEEARRAADYFCREDEDCAVELAAEFVATAHADEAKFVQQEEALENALLLNEETRGAQQEEALEKALMLELGAKPKDEEEAPVAAEPAAAAAEDEVRRDTEAAASARAPSGFEWGGTF